MNLVLDQLQLIYQLQVKQQGDFPNGLYAAERVWAKGMYKRKDTTAFFTACIGLTLIRYQKYFEQAEQKLVNEIIQNMKPAFALFRNKDGHASYNFWQTQPSKHFPGGYFANRFKFFMIPDDIDDSAMIHLVLRHSREEQLSLKDKMITYAIGNLKWPDKPIEGYEKLKPYNTFFIKHMPAAFDICALCNALYFVFYYQLPLNEQDEHSIKLISTCLEQDDHLKRPYAMSPYYPNTVLIIYHLVRLISDIKIEALEHFKEKLLLQVYHLLNNSRLNEVEQLILKICIQKLTNTKQEVAQISEQKKAHYPFFVAGILGEVSPKWLRAMAFADTTHIKYHCLAYAEVLWLEHLLLNRAAQSTI
jgi:hypothetical protein